MESGCVLGMQGLMRCGVVMGSKATATFTSQAGKQESLTMRGNWFDTTADIVDEAMGGMYSTLSRSPLAN
jgi:hypothetical protein